MSELKKYILKRIITFILACTMLISEIPVYAVSDISAEEEIQEIDLNENDEFEELEVLEEIEEVRSLLEVAPMEEEPILKIASPTVKLEKDNDGNVTGITVTNNHLEKVNIYYGLSIDGSSGLSTYITLDAGVSEFFNKEWYLEDDYKEDGTYYFAVMAEGYDDYQDSETVVLDYPITFEEEVSIETECFVGIGSISGRYYFKDYDVESDKILKVVYSEEQDGQLSQKLINQKYGYYFVEEDSFGAIEKLVYEDWSYSDTKQKQHCR